MKILVTGGNGMLAQDLVPVLQHGRHQVLAPDHADLDVTNPQRVDLLGRDFSPDLVFHCAAFTRVDDCESDPEKAFRINGQGTQNVALFCRERDIPLVYISTDYVFDGHQPQGYTEFDPPAPLSVYGRSKLAGEMYVQWSLHQFYIVRTSWLFGRGGPNFVKTILKRAAETPELRVVDDQTGSPTWTADLAKVLARLIGTGRYGIYHLTNRGTTTWYGFARRALELAGSPTPIRPVTTAEFPRPARRPACSILVNLNWKLLTGEALPPWEEALENYLVAEGLKPRSTADLG